MKVDQQPDAETDRGTRLLGDGLTAGRAGPVRPLTAGQVGDHDERFPAVGVAVLDALRQLRQLVGCAFSPGGQPGLNLLARLAVQPIPVLGDLLVGLAALHPDDHRPTHQGGGLAISINGHNRERVRDDRSPHASPRLHQTRYEVVADAGVNPETGRRAQIRRRFAKEKDAKKELAELQSGVAEGTHVAKSGFTVEDACAAWLKGRHKIKPTTRAAYEHALAPLRARHGDLRAQELTKEHLDDLVADLMAGTFPGQRKGWTTNSVNPMLNHVSAVPAEQVRLGRLVRDVAALVSRDKRPKRKLTTFHPRAGREDAAARPREPA